METGKFYFIKDTYYEKFNDCNLCGNKGDAKKRPCYYCYKDNDLYWMIPVSSRIEKYKEIYKQKIKKYGNKYYGIRFGFINGQERAFLLQNICPVTEKYIDNIYRIYNNSIDVVINNDLSTELNTIAKKIIKMYYNGKNIPFTKLDKILAELKQELQKI